jgi:hypothetical protein
LKTVSGQATLQAAVNDVFGVSRVEWIVDGKIIGDTLQEPYVQPWAGKPGNHTLLVKAYDLAGNSTSTDTIDFSINK